MTLTELFFKRFDEARGEMTVPQFLEENDVRNLDISASIYRPRRGGYLPPAHTIIKLEWLFTEDEVITFLTEKLEENRSHMMTEGVIFDYFKNDLSPEGRRKIKLYREVSRKRWLEKAVLVLGLEVEDGTKV